MAPYVPPHLRAQRSAPRAALAGGEAEPSQGGAETKEIEEEEERPSASRVARGPSADNFGARKAQSNGRLLQRARFDAVMDELNVIMCPSLRAHCDAGCEQTVGDEVRGAVQTGAAQVRQRHHGLLTCTLYLAALFIYLQVFGAMVYASQLWTWQPLCS